MARETKPAYRVAVDDNGCEKCGRGKQWAVVGPDDTAESVMFSDEEDADALAAALNAAYNKGFVSANVSAPLVKTTT